MLTLACSLLVVGAMPDSSGLLAADIPRAARLLDPPPLVTGPADDADPARLRYELDRLLRQKPSLGLPVSLIASGGGLALGGLIYLLSGLSSPFTSFALTVIGVVAISIGGLMAGLGIVFLVWRQRDRGYWQEDVDALRARIRAAERGTTPAWPPPRVGREPVEDTLVTLARF